MLAQLRTRHLQKKILTVLSVLIIPGFIAWGTASFVAARKRSPVMEIAGEKIYPETFEKVKKDVRLGQFLNSGKSPSEPYSEETINALAVERLILLKKAGRDKVRVTESEVVGYIKTLFSRDGKFRKEAYDNFLRMLYTAPRLRYRADQFEEFLKEELLIAKIHERIFKDLPASQPVSPKADRNGQGQEPAEAQKDPVTKRLDHYLSFLQKTAEELKVKVYLPTK